MKKIILTLTAVLILFSVHIFAFVYGNDLCIAYGGCPKSNYITGEISEINMGQLIIEGASFFLNSQSEMLKFLNRVELSGLSSPDYPELQNLLNQAIDNMEMAVETYKTLIAIAKESPYNPQVISKLALFDYTGYEKTNGLSREIFSRVKAYLSKGDVTGMIILMESDMEQIVKRLKAIKALVDRQEFPVVPGLWRLNQFYQQSMLTGQYVAEVFNNL